jgi:hypothetical protein
MVLTTFSSTKLDEYFRDLTKCKSLESRTLLVNNFGIWLCYDMCIKYRKELERLCLFELVQVNLFRLFLKGRINKNLYKHECEYIDYLWKNRLRIILDQL